MSIFDTGESSVYDCLIERIPKLYTLLNKDIIEVFLKKNKVTELRILLNNVKNNVTGSSREILHWNKQLHKNFGDIVDLLL